MRDDLAGAGSASEPYDRRAWKRKLGEIRRQVSRGLDLAKYREASPVRAMGVVGQAYGTIFLAGASVAALSVISPWASAGFYPIAAAVIAREQRRLELVVHDGAHFSIWRARRFRKLSRLYNDLHTDIFAAAPVIQSVARYREQHSIHHDQIGSQRDPCRNRPSMSIIREAMGKGVKPLIRGIITAMPSYVREYYGSVCSTDRPALLKSTMWHSLAILTLAWLWGIQTALMLWLLFWLIPFVGPLMLLRLLAEGQEHDYEAGNEFDGTYVNLGFANSVIHPGGDAYHREHHEEPAIPMYRLAAYRREKLRNVPGYPDPPIRYHLF
jgi:fatty acid desaturase